MSDGHIAQNRTHIRRCVLGRIVRRHVGCVRVCISHNACLLSSGLMLLLSTILALTYLFWLPILVYGLWLLRRNVIDVLIVIALVFGLDLDMSISGISIPHLAKVIYHLTVIGRLVVGLIVLESLKLLKFKFVLVLRYVLDLLSGLTRAYIFHLVWPLHQGLIELDSWGNLHVKVVAAWSFLDCPQRPQNGWLLDDGAWDGVLLLDVKRILVGHRRQELLVDLARPTLESLLLEVDELLMLIVVIGIVYSVFWRCILMHCHELSCAHRYRKAFGLVVLRWRVVQVRHWREELILCLLRDIRIWLIWDRWLSTDRLFLGRLLFLLGDWLAVYNLWDSVKLLDLVLT